MTRATSFFLDLLRLGAAATVFLAHTVHFWNPALRGPVQTAAHDAVILFFVLSGWVIAFSTDGAGGTARGYVVARLSRLLSVTVPALGLTLVLWQVGRVIDPVLYQNYERGNAVVRFGLSGAFLNELWFLNAYPPTNTPFWSLGYEAWYYALFGVAVFVRGRLARVIAVAGGGLIAGPKILLLLPVWLMGGAAWRWRDVGGVSRRAAWGGFAVALVGTVSAMRWLPDFPGAAGDAPWFFSGAAVTDLVGGAGWGAVIWFFHRGAADWTVPVRVALAVRWAAGHTFALYLCHVPLVIFATALVPMVKGELGSAATIMGAILVVVVVLGVVMEAQRSRWRRLVGWVWDRAAGGVD